MFMITEILILGWGLILGLIVGFTSIGTGIIGVPGLIILFDLEPTIAVGSISFAAVFMMFTGFLRHLREKNIAWKLVIPFLITALPASFLTAANSKLINKHLPLEHIIGGIILASLPLLLYRFIKKNNNTEAQIPEQSLIKTVMALLVGIFLGAVMGTTGIVGSISLVVFMLLFKLPPNFAVGTTSFVGFLSLLLASIGHGTAQNIEISRVIILLPGMVIGTWIAARFVRRVPRNLLQAAIIAILLLSGILIFL